MDLIVNETWKRVIADVVCETAKGKIKMVAEVINGRVKSTRKVPIRWRWKEHEWQRRSASMR